MRRDDTADSSTVGARRKQFFAFGKFTLNQSRSRALSVSAGGESALLAYSTVSHASERHLVLPELQPW